MTAFLHMSDIGSALVYNGAFAAGALISLWLQYREGKLRSYTLAKWLTVLAVVNGLLVVGSRMGGFGLSDWSQFFDEGIMSLHVKKTIMGGLLLALPGYLLLKKWFKLPSGAIDIIVLTFPLAAFFGRIGCLFAGCCFGEPTHAAWGLCYGPGAPAYDWQISQGIIQSGAASTVPVFPVQGFFIVSNLLIFILLYHYRNRFRRAGSLALTGIMLLMFFRFGHEFFREASTNRGEFGQIFLGLKLVQWICLGMGIFSLICLLIRERTPAREMNPKSDFSGMTLHHESIIILITLMMGWMMRQYLSSVELEVLVISFLPALAGVLRRLHVIGWMKGRVLAPYAMVLFSILAIADISAENLVRSPDTSAANSQVKSWMDFGLGGTTGNWGRVSRDCNGNVTGVDKIRNSSIGTEANLHISDGKVDFVVGQRFIKGNASIDATQNYDGEKLNYTGLGTLARLETKYLGVGFGVYYFPGENPVNLENSTLSPSVFTFGNSLPIINLRIGKRQSYFVDFNVGDNQQFNFMPQPSVSLGLINWGFHDPSGNSNLRFGFILMQDEIGTMFSGKIPIKKTGLWLDAGIYIQHGLLFSGGLHYQIHH